MEIPDLTPNLDPISRLRVLAAAVPGAALVEGTLSAPFESVWRVATDFESVDQIELLMKSPAIQSDVQGHGIDGRRLRLKYRPRLLPIEDTIDIDLRPGWCWMQSRLAVSAMAAVPEGDQHTRFVHLESIRLPGGRIFAPLLRAKIALFDELGRIERRAQSLEM